MKRKLFVVIVISVLICGWCLLRQPKWLTGDFFYEYWVTYACSYKKDRIGAGRNVIYVNREIQKWEDLTRIDDWILLGRPDLDSVTLMSYTKHDKHFVKFFQKKKGFPLSIVNLDKEKSLDLY